MYEGCKEAEQSLLKGNISADFLEFNEHYRRLKENVDISRHSAKDVPQNCDLPFRRNETQQHLLAGVRPEYLHIR